MARFLAQVVPSCHVEVLKLVFRASAADEVLGGSPDFVLDCIDDRQTKTELILACLARGLPVVSAMGAGGRIDPTRVQLGRLAETRNDPLCKVMRLALRRAHAAAEDVTVVFSTEKPVAGLLELDEDVAAEADQYQALPNFRVRVMPVVGSVPAVFGLVAATHVLNSLSGCPFKPMLPRKPSAKKASKMLVLLYHCEERVHGASRALRLMQLADVLAVLDAFDGRCVATGACEDLALRRLDPTQPVSRTNVVLVAESVAKRLDRGDHAALDAAARARAVELLAAI